MFSSSSFPFKWPLRIFNCLPRDKKTTLIKKNLISNGVIILSTNRILKIFRYLIYVLFFKSIPSFKKKLWRLIIMPVGLIMSLFSWHKVERDFFQNWKLVLGKRFICLFIYAFILFIHFIIHQSNTRYVFGFSKWCAFSWMLKIKYKYTWFLLSRSLWLIVKKSQQIIIG